MNYLVFRLYGSLVAWGSVTVGETRPCRDCPGKSAITGLLAAALGLTREQSAEQVELTNAYRQAVAVLASGTPMNDYHTVQSPDSVGEFIYRTRRDELELGRDRLGTTLSSRGYREDAEALVAIRADGGGRWSLVELQQALLQPKFNLYLGRKACPPAAPLAPEIVAATGFLAALQQYSHQPQIAGLPSWEDDQRWLPRLDAPRYYWEGDQADFAEELPRAEIQWLELSDYPVSTQRRQFRNRIVGFYQAREAH